jgi:hypothetical protein
MRSSAPVNRRSFGATSAHAATAIPETTRNSALPAAPISTPTRFSILTDTSDHAGSAPSQAALPIRLDLDESRPFRPQTDTWGQLLSEASAIEGPTLPHA